MPGYILKAALISAARREFDIDTVQARAMIEYSKPACCSAFCLSLTVAMLSASPHYISGKGRLLHARHSAPDINIISYHYFLLLGARDSRGKRYMPDMTYYHIHNILAQVRMILGGSRQPPLTYLPSHDDSRQDDLGHRDCMRTGTTRHYTLATLASRYIIAPHYAVDIGLKCQRRPHILAKE